VQDWPIANLDGGEELDTMPKHQLVVVLSSFNRPMLWF
jgi:hypothetical protein